MRLIGASAAPAHASERAPALVLTTVERGDASDDGPPGLSVAVRTNGAAVEKSPGPALRPGDPVTWTYVVANQGDSALGGVDVRAVDAEGDAVFSDTIELLPAGAVLTFEATGTAATGTHRNILTATVRTEDGDPAASASDTSWYFGVDSAVDIDMTVGPSTDGPFEKTGSVPAGQDAYWRFIITSAGNSTLSDVVLSGPHLNPAERPVEDLLPGESVTLVVKQSAVRQGYENRVNVAATDVLGDAVSDSATARVVLGDKALSLSGAVFPITVALGGGALIAIAVVAMYASARRRAVP